MTTRYGSSWSSFQANRPDTSMPATCQLPSISDRSRYRRLHKKLGESTDDKAHAFLIATSATDFTMGFRRWHADELPNRPIALPAGVDAVWMSTSAEFASVTLSTSSAIAERAGAMEDLIALTEITKPLSDDVLVWRYDAAGWHGWRTPW